MRDMNYYIDLAKKKSGATSDRKIAEMAGLKPNAATFWRTGKVFPSDETMVRLAKIAGVDPDIALLELSAWRTTGPAQKVYADILHRIGHAALIICVIFGISAPKAEAAPLSSVSNELSFSIYYGK